MLTLARKRDRAGKRLLRWALLAALVHVVVFLLVLGPPGALQNAEEPALPAPVAMVFEPPHDAARAAPEPGREAAVSPQRTGPVPPVPPAEPPPPAPPPVAEPVPTPVPPAPSLDTATPEPSPPEPPPPETPPPEPAPPTETPPQPPSVTSPAAEAPPPKPPAAPKPVPPAPSLERPLPPLRPPSPPKPKQEAAVHPSRPSPAPPAPPRHADPSAFPTPMNFSFGKQPAPTQRTQLAAASPGAAMRDASSFGQEIRVVHGHVDPSWIDALHQWWLVHRYYPDEAAMRGEDGTVVISIDVSRPGHVEALDLEGRSGSKYLDMAAQSVFRGAHLPPLPPDTPEEQITVELTIQYILYGR